MTERWFSLLGRGLRTLSAAWIWQVGRIYVLICSPSNNLFLSTAVVWTVLFGVERSLRHTDG